MSEIKFTYMKVPLRRYTFEVPKIKEWVEEQCRGKLVLNLFAGLTRLSGCNEITNDLNENFNTMHSSDALDLVRTWISVNTNYKVDVMLIDPPYSYRKSMEMYNGHKASRFKQLLDEIPKILQPDGKVIVFGYHASNMGKIRGFKLQELLILDHSGSQHSTLATVEVRI